MANVKNASIREIVIDRCLQTKGGRTVPQIMKACNEALDLQGYRLITSPNTIREDFVAIQNRWHTVIEARRSGRHIYYSYKDPDFSIFKIPLTDEILSYGKRMKVIAPEHLKEEIIGNLQENLKNYQ